MLPYAEDAYWAITGKRARQEVDVMLEVLDTVPGIGRTYDPDYDAAPAPVEGVRVVYAAQFGIYSTVDEDARRVVILAIEDQRRDPQSRFTASEG